MLVSILMPCYNTPYSFLEESIESILKQSFKDFELLIIDDNSTEFNSVSFWNSIKKKDCRIKLIKNSHTKGVAGSLNTGLDYAKGKYIIRMDSDDISMTDRIEKQVSFMENNPDVNLLCSYAKCFGSSKKTFKIKNNNSLIKTDLLFRNNVVHPTVCLRKTFLDQYKMRYNEHIQSEDYDLWTHIALIQSSKFAVLPIVALKYRVHNMQVTKTRQAIMKEHGILVRKKYVTDFCKNRISDVDATRFAKWVLNDKTCFDGDLFQIQKTIAFSIGESELITESKMAKKFFWKQCFIKTLSHDYHTKSLHPKLFFLIMFKWLF